MISLIRNFTHTFRRFWLASSLNFIGLVVALTSFFLFYTKVEEMTNYDTCYEDWQSIYRVEIEGSTIFGEDTIRVANTFSALNTAARLTPHVRDVATVPQGLKEISFYKDGELAYACPFVYCRGKELNFWRRGMVPDTLSAAFTTPSGLRDGVIVPRSFAETMFGTADVEGKTVKWNMNGTRFEYQIISVYEDFPKNCSFINGIYRYDCGEDTIGFSNYNYSTYLKIDDARNTAKVEKGISRSLVRLIERSYGKDARGLSSVLGRAKIHIVPIHDAYFSKVDEVHDTGDEFMLNILFISAILVIVITNVNYMNFSLAEAPFRVKNINTRRVFGANRWTLMLELVMENVIVSLVAFCGSIGVLCVLDHWNTGNINPISHPTGVVLTLLAALFIGIVSGTYPAYFATSSPPDLAMKGMKSLPVRSRRLRNLRIAFQVLISFVAIESVFILGIQGLFISNTDYGYDKDHMLYAVLDSQDAMERKEEFREAVETMDGVENVSYSAFMIGTDDRYMMWSRPLSNGTNVLATVMPVDHKYMQTLGIEVTEGRRFCKADSLGAYIVNEAAVRKYPWLKIGKSIFENEDIDFPVVGICRNLHFCSLRMNNMDMPLAFLYASDSILSPLPHTDVMNVRFSPHADGREVSRLINRKYIEMFPENSGMGIHMIKDYLARLYDSELTYTVMTMLFAIIYIIITLIGVACTIMFESEFHRKEIAVRKVFGASRANILFFKFELYIGLLVGAFALSVPITMEVTDALMSQFSQVAPNLWIAYPLSFLLVSFLIFTTILLQRWRYAKEKPVTGIGR